MRNLRLPFDAILYELSWPNLLLLSASLPSYNSKSDPSAKGKTEETLNGDDPAAQARIDRLFDESRR